MANKNKKTNCGNCGNKYPISLECALGCGKDICDKCAVRLKIRQPGPGKQEIAYIHQAEWATAEKYIKKKKKK